jgi:hypothetical protein
LKKREQDLQQHVSRFMKAYRRKKVRGFDPNDRGYDRKVEQLVKRMSPAELDRLINGESAGNAT